MSVSEVPTPQNCTVEVSKDYQIPIPEAIREELHLESGDRVRISVGREGVVLQPAENPMRQYRGLFAGLGIVNNFEREPDREL